MHKTLEKQLRAQFYRGIAAFSRWPCLPRWREGR